MGCAVGGQPAELMFAHLRQDLCCGDVNRASSEMRLAVVAALVAIESVGRLDQCGQHLACAVVLRGLVRLVNLDGSGSELGEWPRGCLLTEQVVIARELASDGVDGGNLLGCVGR
jgi:hypothetical protein